MSAEKIEQYQAARMACELVKGLLKQHDLEQLIKDIDFADNTAWFTDPTLWIEKKKAMDEDREVFAAALKFIRTWPEKKT